MNTIFDVLLSPRFKSLYWATGCMFVADFANLLAQNLGAFHLSEPMAIFAGLVLAQIAKAINNYNQGQPLGFARQ